MPVKSAQHLFYLAINQFPETIISSNLHSFHGKMYC